MNNLKIQDDVYSLDYGLTNQTVNKSRRIHEYKLVIFGNNEAEFYSGENMVLTLPTNREFIEHMNVYFEPYRYRNNPTLSYIEITTDNHEQAVTEILFKVIYHKDYLPFPIALTQIEILEGENELLFEDNRSLERQVRRYKRKHIAMLDRLSRAQYNVQKNMLEIYRTTQDLINCPVCMEDIQHDQLNIPICFHSICNSCSCRCDKCPICRDPYIESSVDL
jgi:hypothetical protein